MLSIVPSESSSKNSESSESCELSFCSSFSDISLVFHTSVLVSCGVLIFVSLVSERDMVFGPDLGIFLLIFLSSFCFCKVPSQSSISCFLLLLYFAY